MRVCEPHHDGTPHWHILLFVAPEHNQKVIDITKHYSLQTDGNEKGAEERRCTFIDINWSKGSATGYMAKYISKSIDGFGIDKDLYGKDAKSSATRIVNWSRLWGIRQFQQFGGAPVTVWREFRRIKDTPRGSIGEIHKAADEGDWCTYTQLMGGPTANRKDLSVSLYTEYLEDENQYGEAMGNKILGVQSGDQVFTTRFHTWTISHNPLSKIIPSGILEDSPGMAIIAPEDNSSTPPGHPTGFPEGSPKELKETSTIYSSRNPEGLNSKIDTVYDSSELKDLKNLDGFDHLEFCQ